MPITHRYIVACSLITIVDSTAGDLLIGADVIDRSGCDRIADAERSFEKINSTLLRHPIKRGVVFAGIAQHSYNHFVRKAYQRFSGVFDLFLVNAQFIGAIGIDHIRVTIFDL